jgi:hypothetical protein
MLAQKHTYSASFTASALLFQEFSKAKDSLLADNFIQDMQDEVLENSRLGIKTQAARKRISQEMIKRYESAPPDFWQFFFQRQEVEQKLALFFLCLKTYGLMLDYHLEVALKRWKSRAEQLDTLDVQLRLDEISSFNSEVYAWSESTKTKTVTVYLRTLTEAGLLKHGILQKTSGIQPDFWEYFVKNGEAWFPEACFANPKIQ